MLGFCSVKGKPLHGGRAMLVLSRRVGEKIILNNGQVSITVVRINGGKVRLGVTAPADVPIDREEVYERKQKKEVVAK